MTDKIMFVLKKYWVIDGKTVNLYEEIRLGRKTVEYRKATKYWQSRLLKNIDWSQVPLDLASAERALIDLTEKLKVRKAWFMEGYRKNCLPRLEARITKLLLDPRAGMFHIHVDNVKEVIQK